MVTAGNACMGVLEAAHLRVSDVRRVGFPLALRAARIGHRDEHAVMRFRAEPKHTARVGVRHHAVGVLVAHVIKDEEQRVALPPARTWRRACPARNALVRS